MKVSAKFKHICITQIQHLNSLRNPLKRVLGIRIGTSSVCSECPVTMALAKISFMITLLKKVCADRFILFVCLVVTSSDEILHQERINISFV